MKVVAYMTGAVALVLLILSIPLLDDWDGDRKSNRSHAEHTEALRKLFPVLEADRVTALRYQDWCKVISYSRGSFANTNESNCIYVATDPPKPFDAQAEADLERLWQRVRSSKAGVFEISEIKFSTSGGLIHGRFDFSSTFVRDHYVFSPGYTLPADVPGERLHARIDADWYHIVEDWN